MSGVYKGRCIQIGSNGKIPSTWSRDILCLLAHFWKRALINAPNCGFGRASTPNHTGGAYSECSPDLLTDGDGACCPLYTQNHTIALDLRPHISPPQFWQCPCAYSMMIYRPWHKLSVVFVDGPCVPAERSRSHICNHDFFLFNSSTSKNQYSFIPYSSLVHRVEPYISNMHTVMDYMAIRLSVDGTIYHGRNVINKYTTQS